jgi:hypothetical protein
MSPKQIDVNDTVLDGHSMGLEQNPQGLKTSNRNEAASPVLNMTLDCGDLAARQIQHP